MAHRILIVDDEEAILFAMGEYFGALGYEVDCARELEEAEALMALRPYSLVIADLRLTGSHGVEGLQLIKTVRHQYPSTRIIMLTAYGSQDIEEEARQHQVDVFLHKPKPLLEVAQLALQLLEVPA